MNELMRSIVIGVLIFFFNIAGTLVKPSKAGSLSLHQLKESQHFVLIHGAWHGEWAWYKIKTMLEVFGHKVTTMDLPSHGTDCTVTGTVTLQDYAQRVIDYLDTLNEPVILVGHSMGGIVISTVAESRPEKISKLVFLAAFLVPNGKTMLDIAMQDTESIAGQNLIIDFVEGTVDVNRDILREAFYANIPQTDFNLTKMLLVLNPLAPLDTKLNLTDANFGRVRRFYIETLKDKAITQPIQKMMYTDLPCERVFTIDSDHSPFFSCPFILTWYLLVIAAL